MPDLSLSDCEGTMGIGGNGMSDETSKEAVNIFRSHGHVEVDTAILCKHLHISFSACTDAWMSMADLCVLPVVSFSCAFEWVSYSHRTRPEWRDGKCPGKDIEWPRRDETCLQSKSRV